jgi:hypothetical protein
MEFWVFIFIFLVFALLCIAWPILRPVGRDPIILISVSVFIIIFSLSFYLIQGNSLALKQSIILQKQVAQRQILLEQMNNNPQKAIHMMKIYIKNHPQDKRAQYLLNRLYKSFRN